MLSTLYNERPGLLLGLAMLIGLIIGLVLFLLGWAPWWVMLVGVLAPPVALAVLGLLFAMLWMSGGSH